MAWLPIYAAESDLPFLVSFLNSSKDIAFIVSNGPGKWIAVPAIERLRDGRYCLWHVPSGSLPLFRGAQENFDEIENPFAGWAEVKSGADPSQPYFGPGHPGVFWLNVHTSETHRMTREPLVGLSSFEWIGNHYKILGSFPKPETEKFWKALRRWVQKHAVQVPRGGPNNPTPAEIWALPGAQSLFQNGVSGGNN